MTPPPPKKDPTLWYKDAIIYELRLRSFFDSNGDGIGDLPGLTQKLDYLHDLGITTIWLLPFYPSPGRDDGYDIADYLTIHPDYGTLQEFKVFLREAHRRDLKVITELVLNHTSDKHPWFQRARRDRAGGSWRNFYVWSDTPNRYSDARIIFRDFETSNWSWDPVAKSYFWHRFYSHQPDLNYDHPAVRSAILKTVDHWLELGVDGLRLDAVPYLFEREGTNCENLPETHEFLRTLRHHVDEHYPDRMLLAEANQWPDDAASYFSQGNECQMAFHFPIMPRLYMSLHMEDRFPLLDTLQQTPAIDPTCQWAIFLRNHDELTLEMVTDEERQYMYRVYAPDPRARINLGIRRRLAPLLGNNRRKIELMQGLLLSLPGTPVLYYGDEIGMGDNIFLSDRNGVRTPMQWSNDRNAGFSRASPQRLAFPVIVDSEYHFETVNVEAQENNTASLLWWNKRLIALRKQFKAFGRGTLEFILSPNPKVLAYIRQFESETILVVANLSRFAQYVDLDLLKLKGYSVIELFGHSEFPPVTDKPYPLTLGPHSFYWFSLEPSRDPGVLTAAGVTRLPEFVIEEQWLSIVSKSHRRSFEKILPDILSTRHWFGKKRGRDQVKSAEITEEIHFRETAEGALIIFLKVTFMDGSEQSYFIPLQFLVDGPEGAEKQVPAGALARIHVDKNGSRTSGHLVDAFGGAGLLRRLPAWVAQRKSTRGRYGTIQGNTVGNDSRTALQGDWSEPRPVLGDQNNSSVLYGDKVFLKAFRRVEPGPNPDVEIGRFLNAHAKVPLAPKLLGTVDYEPKKGERWTLALLQECVANQGTAWTYALDEVQRFFEAALTKPEETQSSDQMDWIQELMAPAMANIRLMGQRTADLHQALASDPSDPAFAPELFSTHYQQALAQSMRTTASRSLAFFRKRIDKLPPDIRSAGERVIQGEGRILKTFRSVASGRIGGARIRIHGDFHLGQLLYTGRDFVVIDFEGEPDRPILERRIKRSPLRDVAGMLRSLQYVAQAALSHRTTGPVARPSDLPRIAHWAGIWRRRAADVFLETYLDRMSGSPLLPANRVDSDRLLRAFQYVKACTELEYEFENRIDWMEIPIQGILDLLDSEPQ